MSINYAQQERAGLCDLFDQLGPDVTTLCDGWTTRDLAAHLVVRERRPDAALGILAPPFERHGEKVRLAAAAQPWDELIEQVRSGPPTLSVFGLPGIDRAANTMEYFIHHEDARRGQADWQPRALDAAFEDELWKAVRRGAKLMLRKAPAGVTLELPTGDSVVAHKGDPMVYVRGPVSELALFVYGRQDRARVDLDGPADAVDAVRRASFGV